MNVKNIEADMQTSFITCAYALHSTIDFHIIDTTSKIRKSKISSRMPPPRPETTLYSYCRSGEPVLTKFWFDGTRDCRDGSDELPEDVKEEMVEKKKKDEMMEKKERDVVLMSESKVERLIDDRFNRLVLELEKKPANPLDLNSYEDVLKRVVDSSPKNEDKSSWVKELGVYLVEWILPPLNSSGLVSAILGLLYYRRRRRTQAAKSKKSEEKTTNTKAPPPVPPRPVPQGDLMA